MTHKATATRFHSVDGEKRMTGTDIRTRREALGLKATKLAELAEVSRVYLSEIESGRTEPSTTWLRRVMLAMDRYEVETGQDEPEPVAIPAQAKSSEGLIEFDITGDFGVHVVVKGPVVDAAEVRRQAMEIFRDIRSKSTDTGED